jgi:TMEM175 potassium channel family protein
LPEPADNIQPSENIEHGLDLDRVVLFSDAVFAIAMTILAISLRLPDGTTNSGVAHALHEAIPAIGAYFLSFAVIGVYWLGHHRFFRHIARVDSKMLVLNLAVLSLVAFLPFPTQVLGVHGSSRAAVIFYAATVAVLGTIVSVSWAYAGWKGRLLLPGTPRSFVRHTLGRSLAVAAVFAASIPIALVNTEAAQFFWLLVLVSHEVLARFYGRISAA